MGGLPKDAFPQEDFHKIPASTYAWKMHPPLTLCAVASHGMLYGILALVIVFWDPHDRLTTKRLESRQNMH